MKAVLVVDMPTECIECPFCRVYSDCKLTETHCIWMATTNEDGINTRAEWCPLRTLPKTKERIDGEEFREWECEDHYKNGYANGWNDCLEEITK